jgi:glycosyltransferase involved in cell wall biosynthesis
MIVGPGPGGAGGIAVLMGYLVASPLADRYELVRIATHNDAGQVGKAMRALAGIGQAATLLAERRVDLVYLHSSSGPSLLRKAAVAAVARLARRPYVIHINASDFDGYYRDAPAWERSLVRKTLSEAALVIAVSPTWERRLLEIAACRTTSVPNPVPIPAEPAHLDARPPRIVCLGRLGDRKGSCTLVRGLAALGPAYGDVRLVLAGDGDVTAVRDEARRLGVSDRVELPGWIGAEERARTLTAATVFALPSRAEGVPVALLEAMAYGLPAVTSRVGGIPDVFEEPRHGYFVPPDDPEALAERLRTLLNDPLAARQMGGRARADAQRRYATNVVAARIGDALEAALMQYSGAGRSTIGDASESPRR